MIYLLAALVVAGMLHGSAGARAEGTGEQPAADPRQLCLGPATSSDERVEACSAITLAGPMANLAIALVALVLLASVPLEPTTIEIDEYSLFLGRRKASLSSYCAAEPISISDCALSI
jgi:hypothetical protein